MKTNARRIHQESLLGQSRGDLAGGVAIGHDELRLTGLRRRRIGHRLAEVLADQVLDERQVQGAGVVGRPVDDRAGHDRTQDRQGHRQNDDREDADEHGQPDEPAEPEAPATARGLRRPTAGAWQGRSATAIDDRLGCRGVVLLVDVDADEVVATVARPAAAANRHPSAARERPGAGIELVLQDDRGRLAVDPRPVDVALGSRRRAARATAFHRSQALFGEMAGETLIAERDRQAHEG